MALSKKLKVEVYEFLKDKILRKIEGYDLSDEDSAKPFQYALFTKKGYLAKGFIHGCETALGSWHESVAKIIAKENFKIAKKLQGAEKLQGKITNEAQQTFENILSDLDSVKREPNHKKESEEIYNASQGNKNSVNRIQTVDLYLERDNGEEIYFEIKGPKPNKNIATKCVECGLSSIIDITLKSAIEEAVDKNNYIQSLCATRISTMDMH